MKIGGGQRNICNCYTFLKMIYDWGFFLDGLLITFVYFWIILTVVILVGSTDMI